MTMGDWGRTRASRRRRCKSNILIMRRSGRVIHESARPEMRRGEAGAEEGVHSYWSRWRPRFLNGGLAPSACKPSAGQAAACIADVSIDVIASLSTIHFRCFLHHICAGGAAAASLAPPGSSCILVPKNKARGKKKWITARAAKINTLAGELGYF